MGEISVNTETWYSVVAAAGNSVNNVNTKIKVSISKTTLSPFSEISNLLSDMTKEFSKYKEEAKTDTHNMRVVAEIKSEQDMKIAGDIEKIVRFPNV